jgi:hypothetical protein
MVTFFFKVNKSFLKYVNHPITVPRRYEDVLEKDILNDLKLANTDITIISPTGKKLGGLIYAGKAGYGKYHQIRVSGQYPSDHFGHLKIGDVLSIIINKDHNNVVVHIVTLDSIKIHLNSQA